MVALPPYARAMGMFVVETHDSTAPASPVVAMDFSECNTGRPGFLHGGAIGGLLEMAGFATLHAHLERQGIDAQVRLKPVNISIEYLRSGLPERIFACGEVVRAGRRVANVRVEAWQADRSKSVASCWMNFLIAPKKVAAE